MEAFEHARQLVGRDADAGVGDGEFDPAIAHCLQLDPISPANVNLKAFERRLSTIFSHIDGSTYTGSGSGGQSTTSASPALLHRRAEVLARSVVSAARSVGSKDGLGASRFDAREIEQRVDQLLQAQRRCGGRAPAARDARAQRLLGIGQPVFDRAEHQGQRRAEFVADVAEERRLGAVDLGQRLGALRSSS